MFARKKASDVQNSLQRFSDMNRDAASRAKHFKLAIETLSTQDKRQLVDDFNFEAFHLIDSLLLHPELSVENTAQAVFDAESALWTLEQVLCFAPELVGQGWQRNAIECILKRALLPQNLLAVRKIAIRLFLIWYQTLAINNASTKMMDMVFQCCLPYFPLKESQQCERILQAYCESPTVGFVSPHLGNHINGNYVGGFDPVPSKIFPIIVNGLNSVSTPTSPVISEHANTREKAHTLQIYLDKFLEYCSRETMKIEWAEESNRMACAKFILDRLIVLYIFEVFPDIEANGVDLFDGWEGNEEPAQVLLDTADPQVIARYWLIRWMVNIASAVFTEQPTPGLLLYRQVLFSNQPATNILLTLMREAMQLPLACSNVIHKVLQLIRYWVLQKEIPHFVESGQVSWEAWNLLLIHILTSFFKSPYLISSGDRLPSAIALTHSILVIIRDLSNPTVSVLPRPLPKVVWSELIKRLSQAVALCCSRSDAYGSATAGGFTRTLLSVCVFVRVIREVDLDERMWDDVCQVFHIGIWTQMVDQWSKVVENVTRALILNLFAIDLSHVLESDESAGHAETSSTGSNTRRQASRTDRCSENGSVGGGTGAYLIGADGEEEQNMSGSGDLYGERNSEKDMHGVVQSTGNTTCWLRAWMRIINLMDPTDSRHSQAAVQTYSRCMELLLRVECANVLVHWLSQRILRLHVVQQPHAIAPLCAVLARADPPPLVRAYILYNLLRCLRSEVAPIVLDQLSTMNIEDISVVSEDTLQTLQVLVRNGELSSRAVRVAAQLALNHLEAEEMLISILENRTIELDLSSLVACLDALSILVLERADAQLFNRLLQIVAEHNQCNQLLPIFCSNLEFVTKLGLDSRLAEAISLGLASIYPPSGTGNECGTRNQLNDLKWQLCALSLRDSSNRLKEWRKPLMERLAAGQSADQFLEGLLVCLSGQFPLPGFSITQWNSLSSELSEHKKGVSQESSDSSTFIGMGGALLSVNRMEHNAFLWSRTMVGRHCYIASTERLQPDPEEESSVSIWLKSLACPLFIRSVESAKRVPNDMLPDPLERLPRPVVRSHAPPGENIDTDSMNTTSGLDVSDMLDFIRSSRRAPETRSEEKWEDEMRYSKENTVSDGAGNSSKAWRQFIADFRLLEKASAVPSGFYRDVKHLDSTNCREVHKIGVIYVGKDQEDKQSILSNSAGSRAFENFVAGLGWPVQIGTSSFHGYTGGLPIGQIAPYFASPNTELIYHVSTMLTGDPTQKLKHIGNDEVHIVWSENSKPYRRDLIATRFCDILIVLYPASPTLVRIQVETQDPSLQFGPLFDGACIHVNQLASLVRDTVLNASRAYRNARVECDRPNKHREKVFQQTKNQLTHLPLSEAIVRLYAPTLNS